MKQLDLFTRKTSMEAGKAYRLYYGYKSEHHIDVYIGYMEYRGDPWDANCHVVYSATCENTLSSCVNSILDC